MVMVSAVGLATMWTGAAMLLLSFLCTDQSPLFGEVQNRLESTSTGVNDLLFRSVSLSATAVLNCQKHTSQLTYSTPRHSESQQVMASLASSRQAITLSPLFLPSFPPSYGPLCCRKKTDTPFHRPHWSCSRIASKSVSATRRNR